MKRVIMLLAIFILTGCSVKYNVTISEDLKVLEEAKMTGTSEFFDNYYKTTKTNVLKSFIDIYKDILEENNYQYELIEEQIPYVYAKRNYDSVSDFTKNSILFNDYFDEVNYTEDGNIKKIETVGFHENDPDNPDRFNISKLEIAIQCPYKVINNSAKSFDSTTNTFYYELSEKNNKILLEYDISTKFNPNKDLIPTIIFGIAFIIVVWLIVIPMDKKNNKKEKNSK